MFEIGWTEMLVIAIVMIVVVGPKDLPKMLRTFGKTTARMRAMAGDFRKQFDEALKEAELDDLKTLADDARKLNPASEIRKALSPMEKAAQDVRAGLDAAMKPTPKPTPSSPDAPATAAEPAKAGPAAIPGEATKADASPAVAAAQRVAPLVKTTAKRAAPKPKPAPAKAAPAKAAAKAAPAPAKATPADAKPKVAEKPKTAAKPKAAPKPATKAAPRTAAKAGKGASS